nr:MAG TPA: hypothetical protein [Caudoviricetes sp.]
MLVLSFFIYLNWLNLTSLKLLLPCRIRYGLFC